VPSIISVSCLVVKYRAKDNPNGGYYDRKGVEDSLHSLCGAQTPPLRGGSPVSRIQGFKVLFSNSFTLAIPILSFSSILAGMLASAPIGGYIKQNLFFFVDKYGIRLVNVDANITYRNSAQLL
jgi:hypothetical protein